MFQLNVDFAAECVKSVIDNNRCVTCDKLIGPFVRFPCGHTVCEDCAQRTGECLFCISSPVSHRVDKPQTTRLKNAIDLLAVFQDTFNIDVYKRKRISDHLKVEKLVFPECIQAPHKYCNKRKSLNISLENKENIFPTIFPGEEIKSPVKVKMEKYVQNWLNKHESIPQKLPRRPFGDINLNTQTLLQKKKPDVAKLKSVTAQVNAKQSTHKKRAHLKSIHKTSSSLITAVTRNLETKCLEWQLDTKKQEKSFEVNEIIRKCEKNESGIVLDDETIAIDDVTTDIIDKDKEAWLAVLKEAENIEVNVKDKSKPESRETSDFDNGNKSKIASRLPINVLFYKKSSLFETCQLCNSFINIKSNSTSLNQSQQVDKNNDVSIVINSSAFTTTIKFTHCEENRKDVFDRNSVAVQTDNAMPLLKHDMITPINDGNIAPQKRKNVNNDGKGLKKKILKPNVESESLDVFTTGKTKEISCDQFLKQHQCLIIEESDTDSSASCDNTQEVIVEVHRTNAPESVECGILRTLSKMEYEHKAKRQVRSHTPNSSNSSDKENLDPNRKKAVKLKKKHKNKKWAI